MGNRHEVAQRADPSCRSAYVDNDEFAAAHSQLLIEDNERAAVMGAELLELEVVLGSPGGGDLVDFDQPVALLVVALCTWYRTRRSR